jgi:hypothetical protein
MLFVGRIKKFVEKKQIALWKLIRQYIVKLSVMNERVINQDI